MCILLFYYYYCVSFIVTSVPLCSSLPYLSDVFGFIFFCKAFCNIVKRRAITTCILITSSLLLSVAVAVFFTVNVVMRSVDELHGIFLF